MRGEVIKPQPTSRIQFILPFCVAHVYLIVLKVNYLPALLVYVCFSFICEN